MIEDFNLRLINSLSNIETRSGEIIAAELGCSRTAVWKHIGSLRALGIGVEAVAGLGYRLSEPVELLDRECIVAGLSQAARQALASFRVVPTVDSTNAELQRLATESQHAVAVLAERQTAGRGRRGRHWFSPFARNVYLSLGWQFDTGVGDLGCLPLVVALAASDALGRIGLSGHRIKWPNDLLLNGRKLGGCLVEVKGDASGPCSAIMGVGVNVNMPESTPGSCDIDQPWTDVASHVPGVSRNELAVALLECLLDSVASFSASGFVPFMDRWKVMDGLAGRDILLGHGSQQVRGTAKGISERGGLLLESDGAVREYHVGEVSVGTAG